MNPTSVARRRTPKKPPAKTGLAICVNGSVTIPNWVVDHDSYRCWARSDEFPEQGRFAYLNGTIWIDLTMEQLFSHNAVKTEFTSILHVFVKQHDLGYLFSDGVLVSSVEAALSNEPDACFISYNSVQAGKARWIEGAKSGYVEVEGRPDLALEVLSDSSQTKDNVALRELYWIAGVSEYWLVDARGAELKFSLLKHAAKGYVEARRQPDGWLKSTVFGRSFRLNQGRDRLGNPTFSLAVR